MLWIMVRFRNSNKKNFVDLMIEDEKKSLTLIQFSWFQK